MNDLLKELNEVRYGKQLKRLNQNKMKLKLPKKNKKKVIIKLIILIIIVLLIFN